MELDPIKILLGFKARKFTILAMVVIFSGLAAIASWKLPKQYESEAMVQVDSIQKNNLTGRIETSVRVSEFLGQQAAVAQSRTVALVVFDQLVEENFISMADFENNWREKTGGETVPGSDARLWAADQLLSRLTVTGNALASSLMFNFVSSDPSQSAKLANAFANGYMLTVLNQRQRRSARNAQKFSDETHALAQDLETAKQRLSDYRSESGIVGLGLQRLESAEVELSTLTARLADARADYAEAQTLLRQARNLDANDLLNLPMPTSNLPGRQAQVRLGAILIQLNRLRERFGDNYPDTIELLREKRNLENNIMDSIVNRHAYAGQRLNELADAVAIQKEKVLTLQESKQTFSDLESAVDSSKGTYDLVTARSLQESLQSRIDVVDVLLLSRAVPSNEPTLPPMHILVFIGAVFGFGVGLVITFVLEMMANKIRTRKTVHAILNVPVLAEMPMRNDKVQSKKHQNKPTIITDVVKRLNAA